MSKMTRTWEKGRDRGRFRACICTSEMQKTRKCRMKCTKCTRNTHLNKQHWLWLICPINEHLRSVFSVYSFVFEAKFIWIHYLFIFSSFVCYFVLFFFFLCMEFHCITRRVHALVWPVFLMVLLITTIVFVVFFLFSLSRSPPPFNSSSFWTIQTNMHAQ